MEVEETRPKDGLRNYYIAKIEELQSVLSEKSQDVRRLEAQRNELNAKGMLESCLLIIFYSDSKISCYHKLTYIVAKIFPWLLHYITATYSWLKFTVAAYGWW